MSWPPHRARSRPCRLDGCGARAWRRCRVCSRPVCRGHRFGSAQWFRCFQCPAEDLRQARQLWEEQVLEERKLEQARPVDPLAVVPDAVIGTLLLHPRSALAWEFRQRWPAAARFCLG